VPTSAGPLRQAAQVKRHAAVTRTETAIRTLIKYKQDINFGVVALAGVGLDFLFGNDDLRARTEKLRYQQKNCLTGSLPRACGQKRQLRCHQAYSGITTAII
jgi:hypothetical protein